MAVENSSNGFIYPVAVASPGWQNLGMGSMGSMGPMDPWDPWIPQAHGLNGAKADGRTGGHTDGRMHGQPGEQAGGRVAVAVHMTFASGSRTVPLIRFLIYFK